MLRRIYYIYIAYIVAYITYISHILSHILHATCCLITMAVDVGKCYLKYAQLNNLISEVIHRQRCLDFPHYSAFNTSRD